MISHEHHLRWSKVGIALTAGVCWVLAVALFCRHTATEASVERWLLAAAGWIIGAGAIALVAQLLTTRPQEPNHAWRFFHD